jgi:branched-chain amino acid transport system substrate-binding protein
MVNRHSRRWLPAVAAVALLATGCAGNADESSSGDTGDGPIVIGTSIALTGQINLQQIRDGYQMRVDEVNDAGGLEIDGEKREIELKVLDNRTDTNTMVQQVRTLVLEEGAVGLLGSCCQQNIDMQAQSDSLKTPLVEVALPVELLPAGEGWAWDSFQSLADGAKGFYELASGEDTNKKVLIVTNNDAQGKGTAELWSGTGSQAGFEIAATKAVPAGTTDFSDVIDAAKSSGSELLVAAMTPPDCFAMWKQMRALDYAPKLAIGLQCAQTPGWASLAGLGDGTLVQTNWTKTSGLPDAQKIIDAYGEKYPNVNELGSVAAGYHAADILINAIEKAGSTDKEAINKALAETDFSSTLGPVKFAENKSVTPTFLAQWRDGNIDQVWPAEGAQPLAPLAGLQ